MLPICVNADPPRSRHEGGIKQPIHLLVEMPVRKKWKGSQEGWRTVRVTSGLSLSGGEREGRKEDRAAKPQTAVQV